jgi:hypothetical protein
VSSLNRPRRAHADLYSGRATWVVEECSFPDFLSYCSLDFVDCKGFNKHNRRIGLKSPTEVPPSPLQSTHLGRNFGELKARGR